jgi:DNA-binding IclR family transcriptional regulator
VFLTVRRRYESVCVERLDGELVNVMVQPVGGVMPLHAGATARALLAYESRQFWDEYLATGPFRSFTAKTETDPAAIVAELEWILEHSYAISDEDVIAGIASLGAAIFDRRNRVRASLSLSGPRPAILGDATETTTQLVLDAANAISDRLGATRKLALSH